MSVETSLADAKPDKLFYVVANVILVDTDNQTCLLLRRGASEKEAAGKWAFPGGKAEHQQIANGRTDNFLDAVALAECKQETNLTFEPATSQIIANGAFVRTDGIPVFWATIAGRYTSGKVVLEDGSFSGYDWFTKDRLPDKEDCIGSVYDEAILAINTLCAA